MKRPLGRILQRLEAAALAAGTLWLVGVTAGSDTAAEAADALVSSAPLRALRWELGDLWTRDTDRKSTRLNSSHWKQSRMPSSA